MTELSSVLPRNTSAYIAFLDECGDHSFTKLDPEFPIFLLCMVVIARTVYIERVIPAVPAFKLRWFDHEGVSLHSYEIRQCRGPFAFLRNPMHRDAFLSELSILMASISFTTFVAAIHKPNHVLRFGARATNPNELALQFNLERLAHFVMTLGTGEIPLVAEARGGNEDRDLEVAYLRFLTHGNSDTDAKHLAVLGNTLSFERKDRNIAGLQIADLVAYPCARHLISPDRRNPPFEIVKSTIYKSGEVSGWKIFP